MYLSKNTSDPSESLRGRMSLGSTIPFFLLPRIPDGVGHSSSVTAIGLWGLKIVSRRSGGGRLSCWRARLSEPAKSPRRFSAEAPISSPDRARRAGAPRASRTSRSLAVRNELRWDRTVVQELAGRAGDESLIGRKLSMERAVSTRAAIRYCPLVTAVCAAPSHSSWLELDVPLRENVLVFDTKLRSLYCAVEILASPDSEETCCRMQASSWDFTIRELKAASLILRLLLSSSSSSIFIPKIN